MPKLSITNVGQATVVIKDLEGYTDFKVEIATGATATKDVSQDLVDRLAPSLKSLEGETRQSDNTILAGIRWSVATSATLDDRALGEGLSGLPTLLECDEDDYSTGTGKTGVTLTGTGFLGSSQAVAGVNLPNATVVTARLDLLAVKPGAAGNDISCEVAIGAGSLGVTVPSANTILVTTQAAGDTVDAIKDAINAHAAAKLLVQAVSGVGTTQKFTAAVAKTFLTGGKGPGVAVSLAGTDCPISAASATAITCDLPTGISAANSTAMLEVRVGPHASRMQLPVVT
ncbi:MAG: hypothetical protein CMK74_00515 [Pseudomonadales bacterium]|nr:hypothetical protein [Pseudomonadales bacterium]